MKEIKLGIVGTNFVSDWLCEAAAITDGIKNEAVYSRTAETGSIFCKKHGIENLFTDFDAFLKSGIDAVYIASPNCMHATQAIAAMETGLHVLSEKPIASNSFEFEAMVKASERNGVVLLEAMRPAYDDALRAVREYLPKIGKVRRVAFEFCQYSSRYDRYRQGEILRAFDKSFSNSAAMDIGVYPVHVLLRLFGKPKGDIISRSVILENGFEGAGEVILPYGSFTATVSYSKIFASVCPSVIYGEDGAISIDKMSEPKKLLFIPRGGVAEDIPFDLRENNMVYELAEFVRLINLGNRENPNTEFSRMEMAILDEIRRQNNVVFPADTVTERF